MSLGKQVFLVYIQACFEFVLYIKFTFWNIALKAPLLKNILTLTCIRPLQIFFLTDIINLCMCVCVCVGDAGSCV